MIAGILINNLQNAQLNRISDGSFIAAGGILSATNKCEKRMMQLHYYPSNASMVPHLLLREMDIPFELVLVDRTHDAHKTPAYLRLNPNGLLPALTDGELVLYETAAICLHLCDTHPSAGLAPALGSTERAHFYKWLMWLTNTLQTTLIAYFYPDRWVSEGNVDGAAEVQTRAQEKINHMLHQLDVELTRNGGPWFTGEAYSALDPYVFTLCRWTRNFSSHPARDFPTLGPYLKRVLRRQATQQVDLTRFHGHMELPIEARELCGFLRQ